MGDFRGADFAIQDWSYDDNNDFIEVEVITETTIEKITPKKKTIKVKTDDFNFFNGVNKALNNPDLSPIPIPIKEIISKNK